MNEIKTTDGEQGGNLGGKSHAEGGVKAVVVDDGRPIEVEAGEVIINKHAAKKHWKTLSKINQSAGNGVAITEPKFKHGATIDENKFALGSNIHSYQSELPKNVVDAYVCWNNPQSNESNYDIQKTLTDFAYELQRQGKVKIHSHSHAYIHALNWLDENSGQKLAKGKTIANNENDFEKALVEFSKKYNIRRFHIRRLYGDDTLDFSSSSSANEENMKELSAIMNSHGFDVDVSGVLPYYKGVRTNSSFTKEEKEKIARSFYDAGYAITHKGKTAMKRFAKGKTLETKIGEKVEREHIDTLKKVKSGKITPSQGVKEIAKEHIKENPHAYTKIEFGDSVHIKNLNKTGTVYQVSANGYKIRTIDGVKFYTKKDNQFEKIIND